MNNFEDGQNKPENWVPKKSRREHRQQDPVILRSSPEMHWKNPARRKISHNRETTDEDNEFSSSESGTYQERGVSASSKEIRRDQRHQERMAKHKRFRQSENFSQVDADNGRRTSQNPKMKTHTSRSSNWSPNEYQPNRSIQSTENWQTSVRTENDFKPTFSVQKTMSTGQREMNGLDLSSKSRKTDQSPEYFSESSCSSRGSSTHRSVCSSPRKVRFSNDMTSVPVSSRRSSCNSATQTVISQVSPAFDKQDPITEQRSSNNASAITKAKNHKNESRNVDPVYDSIDDQVNKTNQLNSKRNRKWFPNSFSFYPRSRYYSRLESPLMTLLRTRRSPCLCGPGCRKRSPYFTPLWRRHISSPFCVNLSPRLSPGCCYSPSLSSRSIYKNIRARSSPLCQVYGSGFFGGCYRPGSCSPLCCSRSSSPCLSRSPILQNSARVEQTTQNDEVSQNFSSPEIDSRNNQKLVNVPVESQNFNESGEKGSYNDSVESGDHSVQSLDLLGYKSPLPDFASDNSLEKQGQMAKTEGDEMQSRGSSRHSELVSFEDLKNNRKDMQNLTTEYRSQFTNKLQPKKDRGVYSPDSIDDDDDDSENRNDFWNRKPRQLCQKLTKGTKDYFDHNNCNPEPPFKIDSYTPRRWGPPRDDGSPLNPECPFRSTSRNNSPRHMDLSPGTSAARNPGQGQVGQRNFGATSGRGNPLPFKDTKLEDHNSSRDGPNIVVTHSSNGPTSTYSSGENEDWTTTVDHRTTPDPELLSRIDTFFDVESSQMSNPEKLTERRGENRSVADFFSQNGRQDTNGDDDRCFYYDDNSEAEFEDNEQRGFLRNAPGKTDSVTTAAGSLPTEIIESNPNDQFSTQGSSRVPQQLPPVTAYPTTEPRIVVELKLCTCASNCTEHNQSQQHRIGLPEDEPQKTYTTLSDHNYQRDEVINEDPEWKQSCGIKQSTWKPPSSQREKIELFTLKRNHSDAKTPSNGDWIPASQASTGFGHREPPFFGYRRTVTPKVEHTKRTLA